MVGGGNIMALIVMAVFDTEENGRSEYTERTIRSLANTVDFSKHRLIVVDNASCNRTKEFLHECMSWGYISLITSPENLGTAKAINQGLKLRQPNEYCVKIDNDVVIHQSGWVDEMEEVIERNNLIGIVGLKRKDINFDANNADPSYRSELVQLSHQPGQTWITVEKGPSIMGTCTMFNWRLLDKIGGMKQLGLYGFDDSLFSLRSNLAGFWNCYLPHIVIEHLDDGSNGYTQVKQKQAGEVWDKYHQMHAEYISGQRPLWEDFE